jgi:SpoVK/Ycf46/Vps4 family AAA+-type ATPase
MIEDCIVPKSEGVKWDDIQGLSDVKQTLMETIIYPQKRPDLFEGIRAPAKGILFYGPPGNGKTFLAKAVATECDCTFINVSASTLVSRWMGEGEKLVRKLFEIAAERAPTVIFFDEIDALLKARGEGDHEAGRRLKTEFLVQLDGVGSDTDNVLVLAATNRPFDLDSAALRRLPIKVLIGLPDAEARTSMVKRKMGDVSADLNDEDFDELGEITENYSASDLSSLI